VWSGTIDGFGRLHKNRKESGYIAEYYQGENEYKQVSYNDNLDGQFFFLVDDESTTDDGIMYSSKCKCVFAINLLNTVGNGRRDQESERDAIQYFRNNNGDYEITGIERGIENIFSGYDYSNIKNSDINPKHIFSVNINLNYYLTDKCN
jgi:hypothetical protein